MSKIMVVAVLVVSFGSLPARAQEKNSGLQMIALSKKVHICMDRETLIIAPKPVDLETATVALMERCSKQLIDMRNFILTGIPNFTASPDFWEKEIEPTWAKEARKKIALARTRDVPAPRPKPAPPARSDNKNQI